MVRNEKIIRNIEFDGRGGPAGAGGGQIGARLAETDRARRSESVAIAFEGGSAAGGSAAGGSAARRNECPSRR